MYIDKHQLYTIHHIYPTTTYQSKSNTAIPLGPDILFFIIECYVRYEEKRKEWRNRMAANVYLLLEIQSQPKLSFVMTLFNQPFFHFVYRAAFIWIISYIKFPTYDYISFFDIFMLISPTIFQTRLGKRRPLRDDPSLIWQVHQ